MRHILSAFVAVAALCSVALPAAAFVNTNKGSYYFLPYRQAATWDITAFGYSWLDGIEENENWQEAEGDACDLYTWDDMDNMILNARIAGVNVVLTNGTSNRTPCNPTDGTTGLPLCSTTTDGSQMPRWLMSGNSNACTNNSSAIPAHINSWWTSTTFGPFAGAPNVLVDPADAVFTYAWDRYIAALGTRYSGVPNVTSVTIEGIDRASQEYTYSTGVGNNGTVACSGTNAQCKAVSGLNDWASQAYGANAQIFPTTNNTGENYFQTTAGGTTSSQPNWDSSCGTSGNTCPTDGTVVWVNKGPWAVVTDATQWHNLGYTINTNTCVMNDGTLCGSFRAATAHFAQKLAAAFPNQELSFEPNGSNIMPIGAWSTATTSTGCNGATLAAAEPTFAAIYSDLRTNYAGRIRWQNNALGVQNGVSVFIPAQNKLDYTCQPKVQISFEEFGQQNNVGGASCNAQGSGLFSTSNTQCLTPSVYAALAKMQFPLIHFYPADWDNATVLPWIKLTHDVAWGQQ